MLIVREAGHFASWRHFVLGSALQVGQSPWGICRHSEEHSLLLGQSMTWWWSRWRSRRSSVVRGGNTSRQKKDSSWVHNETSGFFCLFFAGLLFRRNRWDQNARTYLHKFLHLLPLHASSQLTLFRSIESEKNQNQISARRHGSWEKMLGTDPSIFKELINEM